MFDYLITMFYGSSNCSNLDVMNILVPWLNGYSAGLVKMLQIQADSGYCTLHCFQKQETYPQCFSTGSFQERKKPV